MIQKKVDYIIVGLGLAGLAFCRALEKHHKSFIVFEDNSQNASLVASGMYNPVVLKRFTSVWNAENQLKKAIPFYKELEKLLNKKYNFPINIYRVFKSVEEQNNWFVSSDKLPLKKYMIPTIIHEKYDRVLSDYGFGKLTNTGRVFTKNLIKDYRNYLLKTDKLIQKKFDYLSLETNQYNVKYNKLRASKIIFCEGFGMKSNPFFNYLPMQEVKGELVTIYAPNLDIDFMIKSTVFVLPLGNHYFKVGATFNWKDKTSIPTKEGKEELVEKLKSVINCSYKIIEQGAGIRPTVKDRRPLVGIHPIYKNLAILNGLGTRGVMIAPWAANQLFHHLEQNKELDSEISIARYQNLFSE